MIIHKNNLTSILKNCRFVGEFTAGTVYQWAWDQWLKEENVLIVWEEDLAKSIYIYIYISIFS